MASIWAALTVLVAPTALADIILTSPFAGSAGDFLFRGFYLSAYPGTNLGTVTLGYQSTASGPYATTLTVRLGSYDGTIIGTRSLTTTVTSTETLVTYDFGGVAVPFGSVVTFTQTVTSGPGNLFYDVGTTPTPGLTQTEGTTPPLDIFRRAQVGVIVTQVTLTPEPTTLALSVSGIVGLLVAGRRRRVERVGSPEVG